MPPRAARKVVGRRTKVARTGDLPDRPAPDASVRHLGGTPLARVASPPYCEFALLKIADTRIPDVKLLEPVTFSDDRGFFLETWNARTLATAGIDAAFVQDNQSCSRRGVLRGLHYQICHPQGKLVRVVTGEVFDVSVDLRRHSPTFGRWVGVTLSEDNRRMLWIPPGFAHGFFVLSGRADFLYKTTDYYHPECERTLLWNDPAIGIEWPLDGPPVLSARDAQGARLADAELYD